MIGHADEPGQSTLIVHPDEDVRALLGLVMTRLSPGTSLFAATGEEALVRVGSMAPGLLLASLNLGRVRAADLVAELRRRNPRLVAVFVSGRNRSEEARAAGANRFLLLPLGLLELQSELRSVLHPPP